MNLKKGTVNICMWVLTQGKREYLKGKPFFPVFIESPKLRKISWNSNSSHKHSFFHRILALYTYCVSTYASLPMHQNPQSCTRISEKGMSNRTRVLSNKDTNDDPIMYLDPKPMKVIVPADVSTK